MPGVKPGKTMTCAPDVALPLSRHAHDKIIHIIYVYMSACAMEMSTRAVLPPLMFRNPSRPVFR
ncbi:MAG: hypothetical protein BGO65_16685 [Afipia sp. 64-13]|nr:MAG: hypothetical protein BGO65_16685 [Afipia sp. 64-13]